MALDIQRAEPDTDGGLSLAERGKTAEGAPQSLDRRLFVQLLAYTGCPDAAPLAEAADQAGVGGVVYESAQDPQGVAVALFHEDPAFFVEDGRRLHTSAPFRDLAPLPALTMLGRTYSIGYEQDLLGTLVARPVKTMTNPDVVVGRVVPAPAERPVRAGAARGAAADAHGARRDRPGVRGRRPTPTTSASRATGWTRTTTDFVAGLVGKSLFPLSKPSSSGCGRRARRPSSSSRLGPFFAGRAVWQGAGPLAWALDHEGSGH